MPLATVILILVFNDLLLGKVKLATSCQFFEVVHFHLQKRPCSKLLAVLMP